MSVNFNPFSPVAHFVNQNVLKPAAGAVNSARDTVRDHALGAWNGLPGHDRAEQVIGDATDKLPFNNVAKAGVRALAGQQEITLDQDAVRGIQHDPDFKRKEPLINEAVTGQAKNDPRYGREAFDIELSDVDGIKDGKSAEDLSSLELGGRSGSGSKWHQLAHLADPSDPEVRKTWAVAGNEQTWLLRHCRLDGTAHVARDGTITIDYRVNDKLDLTPHHKMTLSNHDPYDVVSAGLGAVWHGALGASKPHITGNFTRTVPGTGPGPSGVSAAGGTPVDLQPREPGAGFAQGLRGTRPQSGDLTFARMANDAYSPYASCGGTGTDSQALLAVEGWRRMEASLDGTHLTSGNGGRLAMDPKSLENGDNGLRSAIYTDGKGHFVVAFAGTDPAQRGDLLADVEQGTGMHSAQYDQAMSVSTQIARLAGADNVAFTGHSLGGGLAAAASARTGAPAVTFNAAGVSDGTLRAVGFTDPDRAREDLRTNGQIRSYSVDGDPMTMANESGLPTALGSQWHSAWQSPGVNPDDPRDMLALHGGSGNAQGYVQIMEDGRIEPGAGAHNPTIGVAMNLLGPSESLRGLAVSEIGSVGTEARGLLGDFHQVGSRTGHDLRRDSQQEGESRFVDMAGDLLKGGWHLAGDVEEGARGLAGRTAANLLGQF